LVLFESSSTFTIFNQHPKQLSDLAHELSHLSYQSGCEVKVLVKDERLCKFMNVRKEPKLTYSFFTRISAIRVDLRIRSVANRSRSVGRVSSLRYGYANLRVWQKFEENALLNSTF
jgi:hypothetical protein